MHVMNNIKKTKVRERIDKKVIETKEKRSKHQQRCSKQKNRLGLSILLLLLMLLVAASVGSRPTGVGYAAGRPHPHACCSVDFRTELL